VSRALRMACVTLALVSFAGAARAVDLVAVVDLEFIRATDEPASILCIQSTEETCGAWSHFYVYRARVRRVVSGVEPRKTLIVKFGRHALKKIDFRGIPVTMNKLKATKESDPQYQIIDWGEKRELFCFEPYEEESPKIELKEQGEAALTCYESKP
jgi:hypothetical protein